MLQIPQLDGLPGAVILTAIPEEFRAVVAHLLNPAEVRHEDGNIYEVGLFHGERDWAVAIADVGVGNTECAIETERAIKFFKPNVVMFVGIAGGIKDVVLGDVVIADKAYGYETGKEARQGFFTRPEVGRSTYAILQRAKAIARKDDWKNRIINREA